MSGLRRLVGMMVRNCSNTPILSRDIINEAKSRTRKMLDHIILQTPVVDDTLESQPLSDRPDDVHQVYSIDQRIKALVLEMGENRALTNADDIMSRLERAWHLQQESHHDLAKQYDTLVNKLRTLARDIGFDPTIVSADDVPMIVTNLDQRWRQIQDNLKEVTGALDSKNTQIMELAAFLGVTTPVTESTVLDDIMARWTDHLSKFIDLEKALKEKQEESRMASQSLQNIAKLMGMVHPKKQDALLASINGMWTRSQGKITDLQQELFQQRDKIKQAGEQLQNLAKIFGVAPTPVVGTNILDGITGKWEESKSLISQLKSSLVLEKDKNSQAHETLQNLAKIFGVAPTPVVGTNILDGITGKWEESKSLISQLKSSLLLEKDKNSQAHETLQNLAKIFGVAPTPVVGTNILDGITGKWEESKSLISQLKSSLLLEKDKNSQAHETLQGLANSMGVETSECESTIVGGMMDRWTENRREVIELQRALKEEKEKTKQAQEALQVHLSRPGPVLSSVAIQTDDHQDQSAGQVCDKSVRTDRTLNGTSPGKVPLIKGDNILEDSLVDQATVSTASKISPEIPVGADECTGGEASRNHLSPTGGVQRTRDPVFYRRADQELQQIKEHLSLSISYRSHSFTSSASREIIHLGPRCLSLKTFSAGDPFQPPSRSSLVRGVCAIASAIGCSSPPSDTSIRVTKMSDLIPWEESRCRIELGSGVSGTVFLFRHAVSKIPVAAKIVEYPGECFQNEVRIHQAISGLPWFPTFYGSFEIAGDQAVLAMEFIGEDSDDRSHTISDCIDKSFLKTGPDLTREEWFDVLNDVAEGLKAFHSKGFLSNDLKEDNVLVVQESGRWRAKIIDLGWASEIATPFVMPLDEEQIDLYKGGRWCRHVAPECVLDAKPFSTSSDVYSLGRMLASVGRAMRYDDFQSYGVQISQADEDQRPAVQEFIDKLYEMQLVGGGEDGPGSSSC